VTFLDDEAFVTWYTRPESTQGSGEVMLKNLLYPVVLCLIRIVGWL